MSRALNNAPLVLGPSKQGSNARRFGRVNCERLVCLLGGAEGQPGVVMDLSAGGARLLFKNKTGYKAGDQGNLVIESLTAQPLALGMTVVWCKKRGFRRHEIGVSFGEPPAELRAALVRVMRSTSVTNTVYREMVD